MLLVGDTPSAGGSHIDRTRLFAIPALGFAAPAEESEDESSAAGTPMNIHGIGRLRNPLEYTTSIYAAPYEPFRQV